MDSLVCGFVGCRAAAAYLLRQRVGRRQELPVCAHHTPAWVHLEGSPFYDVQNLTTRQEG